ncbi:MAG: isocitrate/isopropylmalate family dehydrogenase, partial [Billgrantia desiderata]
MTRKILVLPGDGIGPEITAEASRILAACQARGLDIEIEQGLVGGSAYDEHGEPLPAVTLDKAKAADAILLGAVGGPKWDKLKDLAKRPEKGLLGLRKNLGLFANLRP